ncbi:PREDICTED: keratocan-like [Thamnophis sirtalis]|uniref:Keratocan-like n=1 Tax=Thamnophis sirtalis TaxID=35019 RepID=A0A6I9X8T3_9SAUR|nr:PREDICTED: keratocan-like [Thamnophis sirtalis]
MKVFAGILIGYVIFDAIMAAPTMSSVTYVSEIYEDLDKLHDHDEELYIDQAQLLEIFGSRSLKTMSLNGTQVCPIPIPGDYVYERNLPQLRYLRLDGNGIKPPIPLDLMLCFRLLQALVI